MANKSKYIKEDFFLKKCKEDIVKKYIGNSFLKFTHADFEKLSEDIFENTKISISISTLKRIWKENYKSYPNISTLDAFAKYLGFKDWKNYCNECLSNQTEEFIILKQKTNNLQKILIVVAGIVLAVSIIVFIIFKFNFFKPNYNDIEFILKEFDSTHIPAQAVFKYDLKGIKCDSVTIRPLGSMEEEFTISADDSIATYTYIRPWQYFPTLTIDGKPVKSLTVNFVSGVWKAGLSNTKKVFYIKYFDDDEIYHGGKMSFSKDIIKKNNFSTEDIGYATYDLFKRFNNIFGDSLWFETRIKNTILVREESAGNVNIALCFQKDFILIPIFIEKSPYSPIMAVFFNNYISGKNNDLSFLYQNIEEWHTFKITTKNKQVDLYVNDSLVYNIKYIIDPGKLTGIMFDFKGLGEVDYVRFYNRKNELIYNDEFN